MGVWAYGCMGVWVYGCMGVWVYVRLSLSCMSCISKGTSCRASSISISTLAMPWSITVTPGEGEGKMNGQYYIYIISGAYEPPKAARSVQLRIIAQNGICIYSST